MFLIGLTGGIAAGKSTVASHWVSLGAIEVDADVLAREVLTFPNDGLAKIRSEFGPAVFDSAGNLNRQALGEIVFSNSVKRKMLEQIIHPLVRQRAAQIISTLPKDALVIYTVPLLVEAKVDLPFDVVVSVEADESIRIQRLVDSRAMTLKQAQDRINSQANSEQRQQRADYTLNSNQERSILLEDATKLFNLFRSMQRDNSDETTN